MILLFQVKQNDLTQVNNNFDIKNVIFYKTIIVITKTCMHNYIVTSATIISRHYTVNTIHVLSTGNNKSYLSSSISLLLQFSVI